MQNNPECGEILTVTAPAAVVSGQLIAVGNLIGVCAGGAASGAEVVIQTEGVFRLPKATGFVPAAGDVAYFDFGSDNRLESSGVPVGFYTHAALTGDTKARVKLDPFGAQAAVYQETVSVFLSPASATVKTGVFIAPFDCKIKSISYYADAKPTSSAGTVLLVAQNAAVSDHTLLSTANVDLETITEDAVTALTLTSTEADLVLNKGEVAEFVCTPNNGDLVAGTGLHFIVTVERTA